MSKNRYIEIIKPFKISLRSNRFQQWFQSFVSSILRIDNRVSSNTFKPRSIGPIRGRGREWREWRTPSIRFAVWLSANGDLSTRSRHNISRVIIESRIGENGGRGLQMIGSPNYRTWSTRLVASRSSLSLSLCLPPSLCARIISILSHRVCRLLTLWWTACWRKYNVPRAPKFLDQASPLPGREAVSRLTMIETRLVGGRHVDGAACVDLLKNIGRMLRFKTWNVYQECSVMMNERGRENGDGGVS